MILDPMVNQLASPQVTTALHSTHARTPSLFFVPRPSPTFFVGVRAQVTTAMRATFERLWNQQSTTFQEVYDAVDPALHFELPSYLKRSVCEPFEGSNNVMGTTEAGACAYWTPQQVSVDLALPLSPPP